MSEIIQALPKIIPVLIAVTIKFFGVFS